MITKSNLKKPYLFRCLGHHRQTFLHLVERLAGQLIDDVSHLGAFNAVDHGQSTASRIVDSVFSRWPCFLQQRRARVLTTHTDTWDTALKLLLFTFTLALMYASVAYSMALWTTGMLATRDRNSTFCWGISDCTIFAGNGECLTLSTWCCCCCRLLPLLALFRLPWTYLRCMIWLETDNIHTCDHSALL